MVTRPGDTLKCLSCSQSKFRDNFAQIDYEGTYARICKDCTGETGIKRCSDCREVKPAEDFRKIKRAAGLYPPTYLEKRCDACFKIWRKKPPSERTTKKGPGRPKTDRRVFEFVGPPPPTREELAQIHRSGVRQNLLQIFGKTARWGVHVVAADDEC